MTQITTAGVSSVLVWLIVGGVLNFVAGLPIYLSFKKGIFYGAVSYTHLFFYRKGDTAIMIDAGYNYDRLAEKMSWLSIDPASVRHILITHQDTDHVGAVEADSRCV